MELGVRRQNRTSRSCILISRKDKTEYPFNSLADADKFLGRKRGYLSGCVKKGIGVSGITENGDLEKFDIILGPTRISESVVRCVSSQPCWTCSNCYNGCSWSRHFIPVEGWNAEPVVKDGDTTYIIKYCPEYKRETRKETALND